MIDKYFFEFNQLSESFPGATIILFQFHVIDYVNQDLINKVYGFNDYQVEHLWQIMRMLVNARTEVEFDEYPSALRLVSWSDEFMAYFERNWLNCKPLWCKYRRGNIPHLDNNTNNRLDASWGQAKSILDRHNSMDECIDTLLFLQQSTEDQFRTKMNKIGFRHNNRYDAEMRSVARIYSPFACDSTEPENIVTKWAVVFSY